MKKDIYYFTIYIKAYGHQHIAHPTKRYNLVNNLIGYHKWANAISGFKKL